MRSNTKRSLIAMFICIAAMFVWIFLTVLLTGGKEIHEFNDTDIVVFISFIVAEILTILLLFIFAVKVGRANAKRYQNTAPIPTTKADKLVQQRGLLLLVTAGLLGFTSTIAGVIFGQKLPPSFLSVLPWIYGTCCILPILLLGLNLLSRYLLKRSLNAKKVSELQTFIVSHRESAQNTAAEKLACAKKWRILTDIYAVVFVFLAFGVGFCGNCVYDSSSSTLFFFYSGFLYLCALSRIRFHAPKAFLEEDERYVGSADYPQLYALAQKAADTLGCSGKIRIYLSDNCNAAIGKIQNHLCINLGCVLLRILSEEELYTIMLHEFSHVVQESGVESQRDRYYNDWLCQDGNPHYLSGLTSLLFCFPDSVYTLQMALYLYASSILIETEADLAMAHYGNTKAAASVLIKLQYHDLFQWELANQDSECLFASESPDKLYISRYIHLFKEAMVARAEAWNQLIDVEILSRSASHPTTKMRLASLGVSGYDTIDSSGADAYQAESEKALSFVEELIYQHRLESYSEARKSEYLEPLQKVAAWEAAGKPVVAQDYADIHYALRQLGKNQEADALCQQAIRDLPEAAANYAHFSRGCYLLHNYDIRGLEHIYLAIENNSNYIEEGLSVIGAYCCLTGNQAELDIYREKAIYLAQKSKDTYSQLGVLKKGDHLSEEHLPEGMLEDILCYIRSVDENAIDSVYLVRKTISEDFFTSVFVVKFLNHAGSDLREEILHKIFCYLDTCSDWQFSLFAYEDVSRVRVETIENTCVYTGSFGT